MTKDVFETVDNLIAGLDELREVLRPIVALAGNDGPVPSRPVLPSTVDGRRSAARRATSRRTRPASKKVAAARVLQGRYMGGIRGLSKPDQEKVKKIKAAYGYEAALKAIAGLKA